MDNLTDFSLESSGYSVKRLAPEDAGILQPLYEQCLEFILLTDGIPPSPTAAREEFKDVPEGKTLEDNHILGLFDANNILLGTIVAYRHYPNDRTWWIGLMMLAPEWRGRGLGAAFYRAFEGWVLVRGISEISLCAIAANELGLKFWQKMGFEVIRKTPPRQFKAKTHEVYVLSRAIG
ncbi:MAG: N-acetyltransferase family protein [Spirulina sp.]